MTQVNDIARCRVSADRLRALRVITAPRGELGWRAFWLAAWVLTHDRLRGVPSCVVGVPHLSDAQSRGPHPRITLAAPQDNTDCRAWYAQVGDACAAAVPPRATEPADAIDALWTGTLNDDDAPGAPVAIFIDQPDPAMPHAELCVSVIGGADLRAQDLARWWLRSAQLLAKAIDAGDVPVAELQLLDDDDLARTAEHGGRLVATEPLSVVDLVERATHTAGAHTALCWAGGELNYSQLAQASDTLAAALGPVAGTVIALAVSRGPLAVVASLAVMKAGAAYLPIDPQLPAARIDFLLRDAQAAAVLTDSADAAKFPAHLTHKIDLAELLDPAAPVGAPRRPIDPNSIAYLMYTSGSTGEPKGVRVRHCGIVRLVRDGGFMRLNADTVMLHAAPLGFDASTLEIWGPLSHGGRCAIHDETVPTGAGLARTIAQFRVNCAWLTAALFNSIVDTDPTHLRGLDQLLTGGEPLSVPHLRRAQAALPRTQLINGYGPTECTTFATTFAIPAELPAQLRAVPIGRPIGQTLVRICNARGEPVPFGAVGELLIGGPGVADGYLARPQLTGERFLADPASGIPFYRTGDQARFMPDGNIAYLGRADKQIKIRGFRVELGEIEAVIAAHRAIKQCVVVARVDQNQSLRLCAYLVRQPEQRSDAACEKLLRGWLAEQLPDYMIPTVYVWLAALPVNANGKVDRAALPAPGRQRPNLLTEFAAPAHPTERVLCDLFGELLGLESVGRNDNFFELGGDSLRVIRAIAELKRSAGIELAAADFFREPTPAALAARLVADTAPMPAAERAPKPLPAAAASADEPIAIIGMAGRFPGAADIETFWANLIAGRDSIRRFAEHELDPSIALELRTDPQYVRARGVLDQVDYFDAEFFGISDREAELMDPQQRLLLEISWECLERAGYAPGGADQTVGIFAGMYNATYRQNLISAHPKKVAALGEFAVMLANEKDYVATRVAHKLNLTGPAISIHTACSTSLVAIATAMRSLRDRQCTMALAGGVAITCPPASGYLYNEGSMLSPDGTTRTFAADASGTVFSDGAAVVLLKPLSRALADGDQIWATILGAAVNNDGAAKASFTAPSVEGQAAVIGAALDAAGVDAGSISYVEAHGTATPLGDPVEITALGQAYARHTQKRSFCRIGSVKSNIGHTVIAAGATGVIKTALALTHEKIPATLYAERTNPAIDFAATPFVVAGRASQWPRGATPRRAGVSAFGVGGTNAHLVLQEAPEPVPRAADPRCRLIKLSARTATALEQMRLRLADHLQRNPATRIDDVALTLDAGRGRFAHRLAIVADSTAQAVDLLRESESPLQLRGQRPAHTAQTVWFFPGQGSQYAQMGLPLAAEHPMFGLAFDEALGALAAQLSFDLRAALASDDPDALRPTAVAQPALFAIEYALARYWQSLGLQPVALVGHSIGEYAAAVIAGVMRLTDAARLVAVRGRLMQRQPPGAMLAVRAPADEIIDLLPAQLNLCADNAPQACVVGGPKAALDEFSARLQSRGKLVRELRTSHAFHSAMMDDAVAPFRAALAATELHAPKIPILSTATGAWLSAEQACNPDYWASQLRKPVLFNQAVRTAMAEADRLFIEVGPGSALAGLIRQQKRLPGVSSLAGTAAEESRALAAAIGQLWCHGIEPTLRDTAHARRIVLPTYPFERKRHWLDAPAAPGTTAPGDTASAARADPINPKTAAQTQMTTIISNSRRDQTLERIAGLIDELAGIEIGRDDAARSFIELGLDSLTLTQAALAIKKAFSVNVSFRQLMESTPSPAALADYLEREMPAEANPPVAAAGAGAVSPQAAPALAPRAALEEVPQSAPIAMPPGAPAAAFGQAQPLGPAAQPSGSVQQLIAQQLQLMAAQLALLSGTAPTTGAPLPLTQAPADPIAQNPPATTHSATPTTLVDAPAAAADEATTAGYDVKKAFGAIARIHSSSIEVTPRQQARLQAFITRYNARTASSKAYTERHRAHMADPRVVNGFRPRVKEIIYQIVIEKSTGSHVIDLDGNDYIDVLNGFGMSLFGWQPEFVTSAIKRQIDLGYEIGPQHPLAGDVSQLICELTGFDRAALCNTGSEAVMGATRIARTTTGRNLIVMFAGAYHGIFDEVIVRATPRGRSVPAAPGILPNTAENVLVLEYGSPHSLQVIRERADELAAVLVEPVQSRRPDLQPREFLLELRKITEASGTLLIFDEVVTGFRVHPGGAQAHFGVRADLATYGKVIGGGFPIGVIAGKRDYMDALDGGHWQFGDDSVPTVGVTYFAGTFVRHPLALAAAHAVLQHLKNEGPELQQRLSRSTAAMADELNAFCREVGAPVDIRHFASLWRVHFSGDWPLQDLLFAMMRSRGIHILDNFPCFMTTAHSDADIALIKKAFKESMTEMQESEFLPRQQPQRGLDIDPNRPPVAGARLGRDQNGKAAWFVANPDQPGKFIKVQ